MKTVLGVGGTEDSFRALRETLERVEEAGDELTVAVVDNPDSTPAPDEIEREVSDIIEGSDMETDVSVVHLEGPPGSALVEYAEDGDYDEIVLGGGERSPMGKINLGRVAEFVLLNSRVSVKLVR